MCVANLNSGPCSHRWYFLVRPCAPTTNLSNCEEKLRLEGWETRTQDCPWCGSNTDLDDATHKLLGGANYRTRTNSDSVSSSPVRDRRSSSGTASSASASRSSSRSGVEDEDEESDPGARARMMNRRLNHYMFRNPEREDWIKKDEEIAAEPVPETAVIGRRRGSLIGRKWRKSVQLGRGMFKA